MHHRVVVLKIPLILILILPATVLLMLRLLLPISRNVQSTSTDIIAARMSMMVVIYLVALITKDGTVVVPKISARRMLFILLLMIPLLLTLMIPLMLLPITKNVQSTSTDVIAARMSMMVVIFLV